MKNILSDDEISDIYEQPSKTPREFARSIEAAVLAKLREQNESSHVLWETGEAGVPSAILDRNGEVVLGLCKICGKGECELVDPCKPHPAPIPEGWQLVPIEPTEAMMNVHDSLLMQGVSRGRDVIYKAMIAAARSAPCHSQNADCATQSCLSLTDATQAPSAPEGRPNAIDYKPHFVGYVDDLFDEVVIERAEFARTDLVFIAAARSE